MIANAEKPLRGRPIGRIERMVRVADEGYSMNFGTSALVEGTIEHGALRAALDALVLRHPLLGASVVGDRFVFGGAEPIELVDRSAPIDATDAIVEAELRHRAWPSNGPRARCVLVRHDEARATIVLTFDHLVSDGGSGVIALRDLLERLADGASPSDPIESPGQEAFLPKGRGGARDFFRALARAGKQGSQPPPYRIRVGKRVAPESRTTRMRRIRLSREETESLARFAREHGATIHGALVAALSIALSEVANEESDRPIRVMHPVDMRRYLASIVGTDAIGDAVGYYVSSVETDHRVSRSTLFGTLASEVTRGVRGAKERGEPFLSAPSGGRLLVLARALLGPKRFRDTAERSLLVSSFCLTNLGALERLGMRSAYGGFRIHSVGFVASPSIFGALCASASSFDGCLEMVIHHVEPRIDAETANRISSRVDALLRALST